MLRVSRSRLTLRLVSAAVLIPVALTVVALGGVVFAAFVGLAAVLMAREWVQICAGEAAGRSDMVLSAGLVAATGLAAVGHPAAAFLTGAAGAGFAAVVAAGEARRGRGFWLGFGGLYLAASVTATVWLRGQPGGYAALMWLLLLVWSTDTGAYAFGRLIGGPAFAPWFSPSKTWAGVVGGIIAAVAGGLAAAGIGLSPGALAGDGPLWPYAVLFALAVQSGDILESAAKRHFGVKDSGTLIPGHGGALDRLDGFLLAVCVAAPCALLHAGGG